MRNRFKRFFVGVMCLFCISALQVSAGQYTDDTFMVSGCAHNNVVITEWEECTVLDDLSHHIVHYKRYACRDCGTVLCLEEQDTGRECPHNLAYNDLGHSDMSHTYEIYCTQCFYRTLTSIPCNNSGPHSTPW